VTDFSLFTSGALFTQYYLVEGIAGTVRYRGVDISATRAAIAKLFLGFTTPANPMSPRPKAI